MNHKTLLINIISGVEGYFVKEFTNFYGEAIMIKTLSGRNYYAPKHEFKILN